jgi:quercetin dioxygenase-like cupin family protein
MPGKNDAATAKNIVRKKLATGALNQHVERVECHSIVLPPGQKTGYHLHEGGVIGYVLDGKIAFQLEGGEVQTLTKGSAFFEPPNKPVVKFDNLSPSAPARFLAIYPLSGVQEPIKMLQQ